MENSKNLLDAKLNERRIILNLYSLYYYKALRMNLNLLNGKHDTPTKPDKVLTKVKEGTENDKASDQHQKYGML